MVKTSWNRPAVIVPFISRGGVVHRATRQLKVVATIAFACMAHMAPAGAPTSAEAASGATVPATFSLTSQ